MDPAIKTNGAAPTARDEVFGAAQEADLTGKALGDFHLLRRLGQGGMGQVYLAEQISLKRHVALKLLKSELSANVTSLQRFKAEAEAVAKATHANIVQVYAIGEAGGIHYMALEYVEGRNLREYLEKKGPPEVLLGLSIMRQVAAALQRASELGIVHRDIKPENILLTRKGEVKVADFGLSRVFTDDGQHLNLTQTGITMGTPLYMSPEQVEGKKNIDHRTDIYSFGVTSYHMFAGHPPFKGSSPFEVAVQHVQKDPQPLNEIRPDLPIELCAIIHKMMVKAPENRYQAGREIVRDVGRLRDALVGGSGIRPAPALTMVPAPLAEQGTDSVATQSIPALRRSSWPRRLLPVGLVLALAGGLLIGWLLNHPGKTALVQAQPFDDIAPGIKAVLDAKERERKREKDLLRQVQDYTKPGSRLDVQAGLNASIKLGVFYLNEKRLDDAHQFFKDLDGDKQVPAYRTLAKLGKAMVLAFKDQPEESNKQFLRVFTFLENMPAGNLWKGNAALKDILAVPCLRETLAQALNYNYRNNPAAFPKRLEPLRHPPAPTAKAVGSG